VVLDEVQRAPALALAIKPPDAIAAGAIPADRFGQCLGLAELTESLAGRVELHTLWPFSQVSSRAVAKPSSSDFSCPSLSFRNRLPLAEERSSNGSCRRLSRGYFAEESRSATRMVRFLHHDDPRRTSETCQHRKLAEVHDCWRCWHPARIAAKLCRLVGSIAVAQSTVKRYIALLEATFLVRLLPAWFANVASRLRNRPSCW